MRANVGCGQTPTEGWLNFDNSISVRLAPWPWLIAILRAVRILSADNVRFASEARKREIRFADVCRRIPVGDGVLDALYTSHMLGYLDAVEYTSFFREARRVLRSGGIIRVAVPDLKKKLEAYARTGDADAFTGSLFLRPYNLRTLGSRIHVLIAGDRHDRWLYDGRSLIKLLHAHGFVDGQEAAPGTTRMAEPGALNLRERADDSVYVEAVRP